jgi:hypothetical protein
MKFLKLLNKNKQLGQHFQGWEFFTMQDILTLKYSQKVCNTFRPHGVYILHGLSSHQSSTL